MNAVEELLYSSIRENPGDSGLRVDLARKFAERGALLEAAKLISESPGSQRNESEIYEALIVARQNEAGGNWDAITAQMSPTPKPQESAQPHHIEVVPAAAPSHIEVVPAASQPALIEVVPAAAPAPVDAAIEETPINENTEPAVEKPKKSQEEALEKSAIFCEIEAAVEAVKASERESDKKEKLSALYVALGAHILIIILLAFWIVSGPPSAPPQIVTRAPTTEKAETVKNERKRTTFEPKASAINEIKVVSSFQTSDFAMPDMEHDDLMIGPVGMSDMFGASMSFGSKNGGMVSFFGSRSKAKKIVFVVDVSASMKKAGSSGKRRFDLMKEELRRSVVALPAGVSYQIIFFNGPAWFAGQSIDKGNWHEKNARNFWSYKNDNDEELPKAAMISVSPRKIKQSLQYIDEVQMDYGTDWRSPLKMAMNLQPDLIFFMTDGAVFENPSKKPLVEDLLEYNQKKSKATINCISLMEIGAYKMMNELAAKTKGEISLVLENSKVLRGRAVEDYARKMGKIN